MSSLIRTAVVVLAIALVLFLLWRSAKKNRVPRRTPMLLPAGPTPTAVPVDYDAASEMTSQVSAISSERPEVNERTAEVGKFIDNQPAEVAALLRAWTKEQANDLCRPCLGRGSAQTMPSSLTGPQKAATVLAQMDTHRASQALKSMSEAEVVMLMTEMAKLPQLDESVVSEVVGEFLEGVTGMVAVQQGGAETARALLKERLGADRADEVMEQVYVGADGPLTLLQRLDPIQVVSFLSEEHPQTVAVILVHLAPDHAAEILGKMEEKVRVEIADRIATMGRIDPQVVQDIAAVFERKFATLLQPGGQRVWRRVG